MIKGPIKMWRYNRAFNRDGTGFVFLSTFSTCNTALYTWLTSSQMVCVVVKWPDYVKIL